MLRIYVIAKVNKKMQMQVFVQIFLLLRIMGRSYGLIYFLNLLNF